MGVPGAGADGASTTVVRKPAPAPAPEARKLGKYEVSGELGRGASGVVYRGFDPFVQREVAIKVFNTQDGAQSQQAKDAFFIEARAAGKLHHPYIVLLYDAGVEAAQSFIAMEFIEGETLKHYCKPERPRAKVERVANIMLKCALALDYIHKNGVLHKDIKPGNIMVTRNGTPKIMDFSIAASTTGALTEQSAVQGSPMYMSPEQIGGAPLSAASDLYSLGAVMYELLCGEPPFRSPDMKLLFRMVKNLPATPLADKRKDLPEALCDIADRLLAKDPAARFATGRDLAEALAPLCDGREGKSKRKSLVIKQDSLKKLQFFKAFESRELGELMDASTTATYKAGDFIIRENESDNSLYILLMGLAEVRKAGQLIALLEKGDCFGEIGFLYAVKRTASVVATTDVMVLKVNAALLEQMSDATQLHYYKIFCENLILRLTLTTEKAATLLPKSGLALDFVLP